jgi:hypothetical protein
MNDRVDGFVFNLTSWEYESIEGCQTRSSRSVVIIVSQRTVDPARMPSREALKCSVAHLSAFG